MTCLQVMLPSLTKLADITDMQRWLLRAERLDDQAHGYLATLGELFQWPGRSMPAAALMREQACGDAAQNTWLCAEPCWVQADINGARMMACGKLEISSDEAESLAGSLRPLFAEHGALIEVTRPERWHLRLPQGVCTGAFASPDQVLGNDLLAHMSGQGEIRRWRRLFSEAQVILHQHPLNAARRQRGQPVVNGLWLWGAGSLPGWISSGLDTVFSDDSLVHALAAQGGIKFMPLADFSGIACRGKTQVLLDLGMLPMTAAIWAELLEILHCRHIDALALLFASGQRYRLKRWHRWRWWRG